MRAASLVIAFLLCLSRADAAELKILTAGAMQEAGRIAAAEFQTTHRDTAFAFTPGTAGQVQQRAQSGEAADIIVASAVVIEGLERAGIIAPGTARPIARIGIGVGAREGAPRPDISTPESFRTALLAARAIVHTDPAQGASSGIATARIIRELGIAEQMAPKTILIPGGYAAEKVASGEAELAIQNMSEIIPVKGAVLVGPLPPQLQVYTVYVAGIAARSAQKDAARAYLDSLKQPAIHASWRPIGVEAPN
jgi:molybdate transport system substrate-binding protein